MKMDLISNYFRQGGFVRNVSLMLSGNVAAQIIGLLTSPIIARLYTPDDFGVMSLLWSAIAIMSAIAALRYDTAIILPKNDKIAFNLLFLSLLLSVCFVILVSILLLFSRISIIQHFKLDKYKTIIFLVPVGILFTSFKNTLDYWFSRVKDFKLLSAFQILRPIATASVKIIVGLFIGSTATWLLIGNVFGVFVIVFFMGILFTMKYYQQAIKVISRRNIIFCAREYKKFPQFAAATALLNSLSQNLPAILLIYFYSSSVAGLYGLAVSVLRKPVTIISNSMRKVFLQHVAYTETHRKDTPLALKKVTLGLVAIGFFPFIILLCVGKSLFILVFGAQWADAGFYAQLMAPWLFVLFINPPSTQIFIVKQKLKFNLFFDILLILARISVIYGAYYFSLKAWIAVAMFSAVSVLMNLGKMFYAFLIVGEEYATS